MVMIHYYELCLCKLLARISLTKEAKVPALVVGFKIVFFGISAT